jgi:hypothetical protein
MQFFRVSNILESRSAGTRRVLIASEHTEGMRLLTSALRRMASLSTIVSPLLSVYQTGDLPTVVYTANLHLRSFPPKWLASSHDVANRSSIL